MKVILCLLLLAVPAQADLKAQAANVESLIQQANTSRKAGDPTRALELVDQATADSKDLPEHARELLFFRARCLIDLNRPEEALTHLERYVAESPGADSKRTGRAWMARVSRRFYGVVRFECSDGRTRVQRDGVDEPSRGCPAQWDNLTPARYVFTVTGPQARSHAVEVTAGHTHTTNLETASESVIELPSVESSDEPIPRQLRVGGHARVGAGWGSGTLATGVDQSAATALEVGGGIDLVWQLGAVGVGGRAELAYRRWSLGIDATQSSDGLGTHGLSVPLVLLITLPAGLEVEGGVAPEVQLDDADTDGRLHLAAVAGLGWRTPLEWMRLTIRYTSDITEPLRPVELRRQSLTAGLAFDL